MCLTAVAIEAHPNFPFICLANRDEFHDRPTAPLHAWKLEAGTLYAGKICSRAALGWVLAATLNLRC